jgi:hypothetical protein
MQKRERTGYISNPASSDPNLIFDASDEGSFSEMDNHHNDIADYSASVIPKFIRRIEEQLRAKRFISTAQLVQLLL